MEKGHSWFNDKISIPILDFLLVPVSVEQTPNFEHRGELSL